MPSTQDQTSDMSSSSKQKIYNSAMKLPFDLKYNPDKKVIEASSPKKHACGATIALRSASVNQGPLKHNSKLLSMDHQLSRDYKVFDVNLSISPLYDTEIGKCKMCAKTSKQFCEMCQKKSSNNSKTYVNYGKSKAPNHVSPRVKYDLEWITDDQMRKAEKITRSRMDNCPIMRFNDSEIQAEKNKIEDNYQRSKDKADARNKVKVKKKDPYDNPQFYKQSFNMILKRYMKDMCNNEGADVAKFIDSFR